MSKAPDDKSHPVPPDSFKTKDALSAAFEFIPESFAYQVCELTGIKIGTMSVGAGLIGDVRLFFIKLLKHGFAAFRALHFDRLRSVQGDFD